MKLKKKKSRNTNILILGHDVFKDRYLFLFIYSNVYN